MSSCGEYRIRKKHIIAIISVWVLAITSIVISERQKETDMRIINVAIEVSDAQYNAIERKVARLTKSPAVQWSARQEIETIAAGAVINVAELEIQREQQAIRNALIDGIDAEQPFRVVAAQREEPRTLSDDPEGEPGAGAGFITNNNHTVTAQNMEVIATQNATEHDLLLRCIQAEAGNQPLEGRQAATEVILNRVRDPRFPASITEVINEPGQFGVVSNGSIERVTPDQTTKEAVEAAICGSRVIPEDYVFFNNAPIGRDVIQIGGHYFGR